MSTPQHRTLQQHTLQHRIVEVRGWERRERSRELQLLAVKNMQMNNMRLERGGPG